MEIPGSGHCYHRRASGWQPLLFLPVFRVSSRTTRVPPAEASWPLRADPREMAAAPYPGIHGTGSLAGSASRGLPLTNGDRNEGAR